MVIKIKVFETENLKMREELKKISQFCSENAIDILNFSEYSYVDKGILMTRVSLFYKELKEEPKTNLIGRKVFEFAWDNEGELFEEYNKYLKDNSDLQIINMLEFGFFENTKLYRRIIIYYTLK